MKPGFAAFRTVIFLLQAGICGAIYAQNVQSARNAEKLASALAAAHIPETMASVIKNGSASPSGAGFFPALASVLAGDPSLRVLVDKRRPLSPSYEPGDLIDLKYTSYRAGIADPMTLRASAETALEAMAAAAKAEGVTLVVSSAYRSYEYQKGSFERWTKRLGLANAERVSARPGMSQHQLGLVVDFGSIDNSFAQSRAGRWVKANAARFGWSLSFPEGYEEVTGYDWESWHYRYVGKELAAFIDTWFGGIQQYALSFIHEWERL